MSHSRISAIRWHHPKLGNVFEVYFAVAVIFDGRYGENGFTAIGRQGYIAYGSYFKHICNRNRLFGLPGCCHSNKQPNDENELSHALDFEG